MCTADPRSGGLGNTEPIPSRSTSETSVSPQILVKRCLELCSDEFVGFLLVCIFVAPKQECMHSHSIWTGICLPKPVQRLHRPFS